MKRVKIYGAGSVGNHLSNAARSLGWAVDLCDRDASALERTRSKIYPGRYGDWDDGIRLFSPSEAPSGEYDYIFIGTPPDAHLEIALAALEEKPQALLIEKPLCGPDLAGAGELAERALVSDVATFVGYDHVVGAASRSVARLIGELGAPVTLDVEFREHWGGIFAAHPWLAGPEDSYLGHWRRGGGACGEHSHAINLWQHFAHLLGAGRVVDVSAIMDYVTEGSAEYDRLALLQLRTETGLVGRVAQDVVTRPARKWARIQGEAGYIEWHCGYRPNADAVRWELTGGVVEEEVHSKTRPEDFILELRHLSEVTAAGAEAAADSPISLARGLESMLVIAAAHRSAQTGRVVRIDHGAGATLGALS